MQVNGFIKKGRILLILIFAVIFSSYIVYKYGSLAFTKKNETRQTSPFVQRGSIVDINGNPLAVSENFYHVGVTPSAISDVKKFASLFAPPLEMEEQEIISRIENSRSSPFVYLKKKVNRHTYEELKSITDKNGWIAAVRFDRIPGRIYPENNLASQLIGFMGDDGIGLAGIEYSFQDILSPPVNPDAPVHQQGKNIFLTIDRNLQFKLEKIALDAYESTNAESLMLIAAQAKTGKIISYISLPSVDLNVYTTATSAQMKDRPATESYEPGSVFKIFSIASFIDSGAISENDVFDCDGVYERRTNSGETIRITCLDRHGRITAREALQYSCNEALAQMSEKIESEQFLARLKLQGFGSRTGVELPGETGGSLKETSDRFWSARSKPTIAIGQEISVSALQIVQAASAIANGGNEIQLTVIDKITNSDGTVEYTHTPKYKAHVLEKSTADYILSCMETVAKQGTGHRANLNDISIGVKTGTAQMADPETGGYSTTDFLSNCIAIFPVEDPEIILYIVIEKAQGETYAGRIVAPIIAEAASAIIDHLGMSRGGAASLAHSGLVSIKKDRKIEISSVIPDFTGMPKRELLQLLNRNDLKVKISGEGWVSSQNPPAGTPVTENMEIELFLE